MKEAGIEVNKNNPDSTLIAPRIVETRAIITRILSMKKKRQALGRTKATPPLDNLSIHQGIDIVALESRIKELPDIDTARVVELYNRIMASEDPINSELLADKLMSFESNLNSK